MKHGSLLDEYQGGASLSDLAAKHGIAPQSVYSAVKRRARKLGVRLRARLRKCKPWVGVDIDPAILDRVRSGELSQRRAAAIVCCSRRTVARRAKQ